MKNKVKKNFLSQQLRKESIDFDSDSSISSEEESDEEIKEEIS